jgi:hypothetical protein
MRTYAVIVTLIALLLGWLLYDSTETSTANQRALQAEIISGKNKADSAHRVSLVYKDSFILSEQARILDREETERKHQTTVARANRNNKTKAQVAQVQPLIDSLAKKDTIVMTLNVAYLACDSLQQAQADELTAQGKQLLQTETSLNLSQNALKSSETEATHLRQSLAASEELTKQSEKKALKRGRKQAGVIGGVLLVIALIL